MTDGFEFLEFVKSLEEAWSSTLAVGDVSRDLFHVSHSISDALGDVSEVVELDDVMKSSHSFFSLFSAVQNLEFDSESVKIVVSQECDEISGTASDLHVWHAINDHNEMS